jgi:hypothetical protein
MPVEALLLPSPFWLDCGHASDQGSATAHSAYHSAAARNQIEARLLESLTEAELAEAVEKATDLQVKIVELRELLMGER